MIERASGDDPGVDPGEGGDEVTLDVAYAEAAYISDNAAWQFNLYKDYDEETEVVTYPDLYISVSAKSATAIAGTYSAAEEISFIEVDVAEGTTVTATSFSDLVVTHLGEGVYRYEVTFVGDDGNTYKLDASLETPAYDSETYADIELDEDGGEVDPGDDPGDDPANPGDEIIFTREDFIGQGTANTGSEVTATKSGVTFTYTKGYCADESLRCYAHGSLTIASTTKIATISFTTTGGKTGGLDPEVTVNANSYEVADLASQARFTEIKVVLAGGAQGIEETLSEGKAVKVLREGNVLIMKGDKTFNVMGQIVK